MRLAAADILFCPYVTAASSVSFADDYVSVLTYIYNTYVLQQDDNTKL